MNNGFVEIMSLEKFESLTGKTIEELLGPINMCKVSMADGKIFITPIHKNCNDYEDAYETLECLFPELAKAVRKI